ncbi:SIMPL domain-containing protein [Pistricoccus aurantiacus]|uniref:SIMPL domain-containing protein n=1 Tax=Pistricoccus aurantiacus TaxID=1883414 RepID=UPI003629A363
MAVDRTLQGLVLGGLVAIGLVWGGSYIKDAAQVWRDANRSVTVKGLAEREVAANVALWPLHYSVAGNELSGLQAELAQDEATIREFLEAQGFDASNISVTPPQVQDRYANNYGNSQPEERYSGEATVLLRTPKVSAVKAALPKTSQLVREGVLLSPNYEYRTEFLFTDLERIKPEMIAEATADARRAAQQFAEDSGSRVGAIKRASQGYFSIEDLDSYTPDIKKIRVVTTIDYALED